MNLAGPLRVSIVIPCRDEKRTIGDCIATVRDTLDRNGIRGEIIVVDNGSADESAASAERLGARVLFEPAEGYGNALRRGFCGC